MNRRQFARNTAVSLTGFMAFPGLLHSSEVFVSYPFQSEEFVDVETSHGRIRGFRNYGVNTFKGIPYAGRVSGERRFCRPAALEPWTGLRETLELGPPAIQSPRRNEPEPAEDCLFLNIWTPANDHRKRPVMFYSHGGGYVVGSGGSGGQDGTNIARNFDVVVVETNHRLGLLGFLYLEEIAGPDYAGSGNMGVLDITAGLEWVHDNISQFGGDPENVMIFGESGGGGKTSCLYAMPEAAPYFNKASIESGPGVRMLDREVAAETTYRVLRELELSPNNWQKLLAIPAAELLKIQNLFPPVAPYLPKQRPGAVNGSVEPGFGPVVDGQVLPHHPFDPAAPEISNDKPLITGWNEDEYTFFAWERGVTSIFEMDFEELPATLETTYGKDTPEIISVYRDAMPEASAPQIYVAIQSICMMGLGTVDIAEKKAQQRGAPVFLYNFGYKSDMKIPGTDYPMGTPHAMDISFKFNNEVPPREGESERRSFAGNNPDRYIASSNMAALWTSFARTGTPSADGIPSWPAYNLADRACMRIDTTCEVLHQRYQKELGMWKSAGWF